MAKISKKAVIERIALERMYRLFELAEQNFDKHRERSRHYVELALRIGKRCNVSMPAELKKRFCKRCGEYLKVGVNSKIRVTKGIMKVTCLTCGYTRRIRVHTTNSLRKRSGTAAETIIPKSKNGAKGGRSR